MTDEHHQVSTGVVTRGGALKPAIGSSWFDRAPPDEHLRPIHTGRAIASSSTVAQRSCCQPEEAFLWPVPFAGR